jgi:caa(3)-type oxidase subunit IV
VGHSSAANQSTPHHGPAYYVKIWAILLVLLVISILGPELKIQVVTLITAFGIAIVKAVMVAAYFMHLNVEKRIAWLLIGSMFIAMLLFVAGIAPDVGKVEGRNWENRAHKERAALHQTAPSENGGEHK